jgi:hypothetical protein
MSGSGSHSLEPGNANSTVGSAFMGTRNPGGFLLLRTRALEHLGREIQVGSLFLGTQEPGPLQVPDS